MTTAPTLLNQILAIEKGVKATAARVLTDAYQQLQKPAPLTGILRSYRPRDDEGERLPEERTEVKVRVGEELAKVRAAHARMFDLMLTKDLANTRAKSDIVVDGQTLLTDVPVTTMLTLEKQLQDLRTFVAKLPILDIGERWTWDDDAKAYVTAPRETTRTKKVMRNHVLAEATDKHPAQVQVYQEDVIVGYWRTLVYSGAVPGAQRAAMLDRVDRLLAAVRSAREAANTVEVSDAACGQAIMGYLWRDAVTG
jgi:hypothetical protein